MLGHRMQRGVELRAAIAFEAAEDVPGQAFGMEPYERSRIAALIADYQGNVFAGVCGRAESNNLCILAGADRKPGAGHDAQGAAVRIMAKVLVSHRLRFTGSFWIDQKGWQDPCDPREFHCGFGDSGPREGFSLEGSFEGVAEVERRIGNRHCIANREIFAPAYKHRCMRDRSVLLIGKFERSRARCRDQHVFRPRFARHRGFDRQQHHVILAPTVEPQGPTVPQGIDSLRSAPFGGEVFNQISNSVMSGM